MKGKLTSPQWGKFRSSQSKMQMQSGSGVRKVIGILVDADLILEALINRNHIVGDIGELFDRMHPAIEMYVTDVGWQKIYTYASRLQNTKVARAVIDWLQEKLTICAVDRNIMQTARTSKIQDFESAVEIACASVRELSAIVTHRREDFGAVADKFSIWSVADLQIRVSLEHQFHTLTQCTQPPKYAF